MTSTKPFAPISSTPRGTRPLQERARRTRERILDVAADAFARDGYEGASLNELIRDAGLTKGAFYFHFASKEELALATFRYKQEQVVAQVLGQIANEADAIAELRALLQLRARLYAADPSTRCIQRLGAELGAKAGPDSEFARFQELTIETLARIVRRGQREGAIRSELDPRRVAETLYAAMIGIDRTSRYLAAGADLEQRGLELVELITSGLAPREPASGAKHPRGASRRTHERSTR